MSNKIYYGSISCQGVVKSKNISCTNLSYWVQNENGKRAYRCGVHSDKTKRQKLPRDPNAKEKRLKLYADRQKKVEIKAAFNSRKWHRGHIIVTKLRMMKSPEHHDGYLKVFPNFKHKTRPDGFGCPQLSPKSLGPIDHGMPDLPIAKNLENYHQSL